MMGTKIRLGISACLLGENVRYNGEHSHDPYLTKILGRRVEYVPVCPEVECGLPVPRETMKKGKTRGNLVDFHTRHKLLILSHSQKNYREMGKSVASAKDVKPSILYDRYGDILGRSMALNTTRSKNVNVLMHMMGYFKKMLSSDEKQEMLEIIGQYRKGYVPLIVPLTLLNHYVRKYNVSYLASQVYLNPHPVELGLRNHS